MNRPLSGLRAWAVQRLTAVVLLGFAAVLPILFSFGLPDSYATWRDLIRRLPAQVMTLALFAALLLHAWVGVRDVVLDYVRPRAVGAAVLMAVAAGLAGIGIWVLAIVLKAA